MRLKIHTFLVLIALSFSSLAQTERQSHEAINVDGYLRERGETSQHERSQERASGRNQRERDSRSSSSGQRGSSTPTSLTPFLQSELSDVYGAYANIAGYSYVRDGYTQSIEAFAPIDLFETPVKDGEKGPGGGLDYAGQFALGEARDALRQDGRSGAVKHADKMEKIRVRDQQAKEKDRSNVANEFQRQDLRPTPSDLKVAESAQKLNQALSIAANQVARGQSRNLRNQQQLDAAAFYGSAHVVMAKIALNKHTRTAHQFGESAEDVAREMRLVADSVSSFLLGVSTGAEKVVVSNIEGVVEVSRFVADSITDPVSAFNQVMNVWESINPEFVADFISHSIAQQFHELNSRNSFRSGQALGVVATTALSFVTPVQFPHLVRNLANAARSSQLVARVERTAKALSSMERFEAAWVNSLFSKIVGSQYAGDVIQTGHSYGLRTREQFEGFAQFAALVKNQVGSVGEDITLLARDYASMFKAWPKGGIITKVENADDLNRFVVANGLQSPYLGGTLAARLVLSAEKVFVRFHKSDNVLRSWMADIPEVRGMTALQIKNEFNLPDVPTHVSFVRLKVGDEIRLSKVGPNAYGTGVGKDQVELLRPLTPSDIIETRPIGGGI